MATNNGRAMGRNRAWTWLKEKRPRFGTRALEPNGHTTPPPSGIDRSVEAVKYSEELNFWRGWVKEHGAEPETEYYRRFMMDMGGIQDQAFFDDLICVDIGCGPKGSLTWLNNARAAIGIDPLADAYRPLGIRTHNMVYLWSKAEAIPLPSHYADVVFSMNSLDHVDSLIAVCKEIRRILKPGGFFIGSLNLGEPPTATEPWTLTEGFLHEHLFDGWESEFYEVRPRLSTNDHFGPYRYFYEPCPEELLKGEGPRALWCRFRVR